MTTRFLGALLTLAVVAPAMLIAQPPGERDARPIRLRAVTFRPMAGELPSLGSDLTVAARARGRQGIYLVQSSGPITEAWKAAVTTAGAELLEYVPEFTFKARMTPAAAARVARVANVAWVGPFHPGYKLAPDLARNGTRPFVLTIERDADVASVIANVARTGARVLRREGRQLTVRANAGRLAAMARVLDVASIENFRVRVKHNEFGGGLIMGSNIANSWGYTGSTQTVALADTGLGTGTAIGAHIDIPPSRIANIYNWPGTASGFCFDTIVDDGAVDVDTGHGTHTALSAVGGGGPSGEGQGTAPGASLIFQAVENFATTTAFCKQLYGLPDGYYLTGLPVDIRLLFDQAYAAGARVHSNSWGIGAASDYTVESHDADDYVWTHPDLTITFSAGNAGTDANADGVIDLGSMSAPATAKNVISVGASENDRLGDWGCDLGLGYTDCAAQGGQNSIFTYGTGWPGSYPANPLRDDPSGGDQDQMAAFSSRGPVLDGRIKPDVVAPGTWVLSGYADPFQQEYDPSANPQNGLWQYDGWGYPRNYTYKYMGGTSMSSPSWRAAPLSCVISTSRPPASARAPRS